MGPASSFDAPDTAVRPGRHRRRRRRKAIAWTARVAILTGAALLAQVAMEQWGTGVATARAQAALRAGIAEHGFPTRPIPGDALGFIRIPSIRLDVAFVEGVTPEDLARGPGHYPRTSLPGSAGNVAIAGHRTTHLAPFWALDALSRGDEIVLRTRAGRFVYRVEWVRPVSPDASWVTAATPTPSLTLTTCNPRFSASQRLVVRAALVASTPPPPFAAVAV